MCIRKAKKEALQATKEVKEEKVETAAPAR